MSCANAITTRSGPAPYLSSFPRKRPQHARLAGQYIAARLDITLRGRNPPLCGRWWRGGGRPIRDIRAVVRLLIARRLAPRCCGMRLAGCRVGSQPSKGFFHFPMLFPSKFFRVALVNLASLVGVFAVVGVATPRRCSAGSMMRLRLHPRIVCFATFFLPRSTR